MSFVEFCISNGYKAYRKFYNRSLKTWEYVEVDDTNYFSSCVGGYIDIRLLKDGEKEIVYGLGDYPYPPTLIWPNPFGRNSVDALRAFETYSFETILNIIENKNNEDGTPVEVVEE
jgi:hypothetical protein